MSATPRGDEHVAALAHALDSFATCAGTADRWGTELLPLLDGGARLLAAGNGGSAAQAQHLTAELVGRYRDDRAAFSAIALCVEPSSITAIGNDYGIEEMFARQVRAHGRPGDVLIALSTSGTSPNILAAADAAARHDLRTWVLTGPPGNPLAARSDDCVCVDTPHTATVQEIHLIAIHLLCAAVDEALASPRRFSRAVVA
jgi:D-sedoheptulose 7-phosphate isomerase